MGNKSKNKSHYHFSLETKEENLKSDYRKRFLDGISTLRDLQNPAAMENENFYVSISLKCGISFIIHRVSSETIKVEWKGLDETLEILKIFKE